MIFVVHGKPFRAHRCILGARSTYFANMLDTKWKGKSVVVLRHPLVRPSRGGTEGRLAARARGPPPTFPPGCVYLQINPVAFGALLQYLYTGEPPGPVGPAGRGCLSSSRPSCGLRPTLYVLVLVPCGVVLFQLPPGWAGRR